MIRILNVTKHFGQKIALSDINVELPDTGLVIIKGKNGSGKSTLMNLIGGLDKPSSGIIVIDDIKLSEKSEEQLYKYREEYVGFIFQDNNLFENISVKENLTLTGDSLNFNKLVDFLGLSDLLDKKAKELSGGEQQRVAIARALLKNPKIILADEPTSSIDTESKIKILNFFKKISANRLILMISHDTELIEDYADVILNIDEGRLIDTKIINKVENHNTAVTYKNSFKFKKFAFENLFINKKQIVRSCVMLIISFIFILIATSIASINYKAMHADTMNLENDSLIIFDKLKQEEDGMYYSKDSDGFLKEDIEYLEKNKVTKSALELGKSIYINSESIKFNINYDFSDPTVKAYYHATIPNNYFFSINNGKEIKYGSRPNKNNEVVITSYMADLMIKFGVLDETGEYYKPVSYDDLIKNKKELVLGNHTVVVSGIFELNLNKFQSLKEETNTKLYDNFQQVIKNMAGTIFVNDSFLDLYSDVPSSIDENKYAYSYQKNVNYDEQGRSQGYSVISPRTFNEPILLKDGNTIETLGRNEIIANKNLFYYLNCEDEESCIGKTVNLYIREQYKDPVIDTLDVVIIGFSEDNCIYVNQDDIQKYTTEKVKIDTIVTYEKDRNILEKIFKTYPTTRSKYIIKTNYSEQYDNLMETCKAIAILFMVISIAFIILSIIFLFNYIMNSIDTHKKEIAVLKSLGIGNSKILSAFALEITTLSVVAYLYAIFAFFLLRLLINYMASNWIMFKVNVSPINILLLLIIIVVTLLINLAISLSVFKKIKKTSPQILFKNTSI